MIKVNEIMRSYDISKMSKTDYWRIRQGYENMSKKEKKAFDREFVKLKQNFSFQEWWDYIGERIKEGRKKHIRDLNRPYLKNTKIENMKRELEDPEVKKYLHLQ